MSQRTFAGEVLESRYRALDLEPLAVEDCYTAVLELTSTVKEDQRLYHVIVENDRGSDRRALMLRVDEPGSVIITIFHVKQQIVHPTCFGQHILSRICSLTFGKPVAQLNN